MEKDPALKFSFETVSPTHPDVAKLVDTLITPELHKATIGSLRGSQSEWLKAQTEAIMSDPTVDYNTAKDLAFKTISEQMHSFNEEFLSTIVSLDDPSFKHKVSILDRFSITSMDDTKWILGEKNADGKYDKSKSGQTDADRIWKKCGGEYKRKLVDTDEVDEEPVIEPTLDEPKIIDEPADDEPDVDEPEIIDEPADDEPDVDTAAAEVKAEQVADAAAKKVEHDIAVGNLDGARTALALIEVQYRTKKMFARKRVNKERLAEMQEAYHKAAKAEAIAGFELIKADHIAEDKAEPTPKELNLIAQMAFAEEFKKFAAAQNEEGYMTDYGIKARKFGEVSLGKRLKRTTLILGLGAVGMATGGIFAAGLFGTATALRIWQTKAAGTVGHSTKKGTERITNKINKKIVRETNAGLSINETGDTNDLADMISSGHRSVSERTRRSNSIRRKLVPVLIASAAAGGVVKSFAEWNEKKDLVGNVRENLQDFDWRHPLHEWNPFNHNEGPSGSGSVRDTADTLTPSSGGTSEQVIVGGGFGPTGAPGAMQEAAAAKAAAELATQEAANLASPDRLLNANGNYPWGRAMDFFNGDSQAANSWLQTAVAKTPGAQWHNVGDGISTNDWISINGVSDTDAVWKELTKNMLKG